MANPPVVLDSCVFADKGFMRWLRTYRGAIEIPPVVYCELAVIAVQRRGDTAQLDGLLRGANINVSDMQMDHGRKAAQLAAADPNWKQKWRDYMIAAHAYFAPHYLVTANVRDFVCLGDRVKLPQDFKDGVADGSIR